MISGALKWTALVAALSNSSTANFWTKCPEKPEATHRPCFPFCLRPSVRKSPVPSKMLTELALFALLPEQGVKTRN